VLKSIPVAAPNGLRYPLEKRIVRLLISPLPLDDTPLTYPLFPEVPRISIVRSAAPGARERNVHASNPHEALVMLQSERTYVPVTFGITFVW
jgi:hypothetical protein